jgi:surface protein
MKSGMSMWKQMVIALAAVLLAGVMAVALPEPVFAAKKDIASGGDENITWVIDANGKLTVKGTGDVERIKLDDYSEEMVPEWYENRYDITSAVINVTGMTDASYFFYRCNYLESVDLNNFKTSTVTDMSYMFADCWLLETVDLSGFDTSNVTSMAYMFWECSSLKELSVSNFNTGKVTDMRSMFCGCGLKKLDVSNFDTSKVTDMGDMFYDCGGLTNLDLSNFDTGEVKDMSHMFEECRDLTNLNVSGFKTSKVKDMNSMFSNCTSLTKLDLSNFYTGAVDNMNSMFWECTSLAYLDVSNFDTSNTTYMGWMFYDCESLTKLDMSNFNTSNAILVSAMFYGCSSLSSLDMSNFDLQSIIAYLGDEEPCLLLLSGCSSLTTIYTPYNVGWEIDLPTADDYAWCLPNGTVVTEVPKNSSKSVKLTRKPQYTENNTTVKLSETSYTYTGKALKPTVSVKDSNGKKINSKYYTVTYKNNKKVGKATLTIKFRNGYVGTITKTFKINPKATSLKKATSAKTKTIAVKWKKQATQTTGYEIQYSTSSKFTKKATKTATVKSAKTTSTTIKKLSAKKKYYVRIRTYKTVDGKKYYSDWSKALSVKTK